MKSQRRKRLEALLGVCCAAIAIGCSSRADRPGTVQLALTIPPGGPSVNAVQWRITTSLGALVASGTIQTADVNATASVDTSCPAGSGFVASLSATASDGTACSGQSQPFNVSIGASVPVAVTLVCGGSIPPPAGGSVVVTATVVAGDNCPVITSWEVSPLRTTSEFGHIDLSATASDADPGDTVTYQWTATQGTFVNPTAQRTQYSCGPPGRVDLSLIVSDGHLPKPCTAATSFSVFCVEIDECGNGIRGPGEQCDPPDLVSCSAVCQCIGGGNYCEPPPLCGNSIIEVGEECDPPDSPGCNSTCHFASCGDGIRDTGEECDPPNGTTCRPGCIVARCGDGILDPGETCDPPDGVTCGSGCVALATCGNGVIEPGETCDPPTPSICSATCQSLCPGPSSVRDMCEQADPADCPPTLEVVPGATSTWGCAGFGVGSLEFTHCDALLTCIRSSGCMAGDDPTPCLCGSLSPPVCANMGAPTTAPCAAEYAAAAADGSGSVFQQFGFPGSPVGIADNIAACDVDSACLCR
jgi:hypothetical protein